MAVQNGTLVRISVGGTIVGHSISDNFTTTVGTRDTTTKDSSGWTEKAASLKGWSFDSKGYFDPSESNESFDELYTAMVARTAVTVLCSSDVTGEKEYTGSAIITELTKGAELEGNVTYSVKFEGTGALTQQTIS